VFIPVIVCVQFTTDICSNDILLSVSYTSCFLHCNPRKLYGCIVWKLSTICAQAVYFLHSTMPSVACRVLSNTEDNADITQWCQRYLPCYLLTVSNSGLLIFHVGQPGSTWKIWGGFLYETYRLGGMTLNLFQRWKLFGSEFPAIYNHCGVMAAWSRKTLKYSRYFCVFFEKPPLTVKFSKFCSESYITSPIDVLHANLVKFGRQKIRFNPFPVGHISRNLRC